MNGYGVLDKNAVIGYREKYFSDLIANTEKLQILCRSKPIWFSLCSSIRQLVGIYERGQ